MRLGFLSSHGGSGARAVVQAVRSGELDAEPVVLISNNSSSQALAFARQEGLQALHLSSAHHPDPAELDRAILSALQRAGVDVLVLSGYMKELGPATLAAYHGRLVNVHPSLLPRYGGRGMYGDRVHQAVLAAGDAESGATVHQVEAGIDEGPILLQQRVPVQPDDTLETLRARVMAVEGPLLVAALRQLGQQL
ncbi:phosphoribosylglycinamide formyltransferase [Deinococcus sonorensis]|uniref:Phosphoribosylglycinamide formyltransferase n=2 Tax=Deinococcus sonorensis TaxID=309891 RepID=A0AAU7UA53_9DEIO